MLSLVLVIFAMAAIVAIALTVVGIVAFPGRGRAVPPRIPRAAQLNRLLTKLNDSAIVTAIADSTRSSRLPR